MRPGRARHIGAENEFQIPMRGNESDHADFGQRLDQGFQIPMRGNELEESYAYEGPGQVSNPHEG